MAASAAEQFAAAPTPRSRIVDLWCTDCREGDEQTNDVMASSHARTADKVILKIVYRQVTSDCRVMVPHARITTLVTCM